MPEEEEEEEEAAAKINPYSGLFALKPRQVLLALHQKQQQSSSSMANQLTPDPEASISVLLHSVLNYLHRNGFSKASNRLLKDAHIQGDSWKSCSLDLEDMYSKYIKLDAPKEPLLASSSDLQKDDAEKPKDKLSKKRSASMSESIQGNGKQDTSEHVVSQSCDGQNVDEGTTKTEKMKKTKSNKLNNDNESAPVPGGTQETSEQLVSQNGDGKEVDKGTAKKEKKKKSKSTKPDNENELSLVSGGKQETSESLVSQNGDSIKVDEGTAKKEKKKKRKSSKLDTGDCAKDTVEEKLEIKTNEGALQTKGKDSKKRKRMDADENVSQQVEGEEIEESKRRKTVVGDGNGGLGSETPNGNFENGLKNSDKKSTQKHNDSSEPKTINAFQRVKVDEVEFVDDRLRDNSYWAKDGADSGYGAKAQEVLGQVRGRGFRHEKTKKKRGTYRGGQIDLQSHSIKFNYSDED